MNKYQIKFIGDNAIISDNLRIRYPESIFIGKNSIIDDFCYISTSCSIGTNFHIASNCTIAGGKNSFFQAGDFGTLCSGCRAFCASDDFVNDIAVTLPKNCDGIKNHLIQGIIRLEDFVTIGANSVIMPNNFIPDGVVIGAMSFIPSNFKFEPWSVYRMVKGKLKKTKNRNKENVSRQIKILLERINNE